MPEPDRPDDAGYNVIHHGLVGLIPGKIYNNIAITVIEGSFITAQAYGNDRGAPAGGILQKVYESFTVSGKRVYKGKLLPDLIQTLISQILIRKEKIFKKFFNLVLDPQRQRVDFQPQLRQLFKKVYKVILYVLKALLDIGQLLSQGAAYGFLQVGKPVSYICAEIPQVFLKGVPQVSKPGADDGSEVIYRCAPGREEGRELVGY